jgi:hypothetical protein
LQRTSPNAPDVSSVVGSLDKRRQKKTDIHSP